MSYRTIAVGIDLSPESEIAAMQAMRIARHCGARVVLVQVGLVPEHAAGVPKGMRATEESYLAILKTRLADERARLEDLRQRLLGQGVDVSHVVAEGHADVALPDAARELGADLIVVGTHGRTGLRRALLGSVAERTVRFASSSVLVARGATPAGEGGFHRIVVGTDYSPLGDGAIARALEVAARGARVDVVHAWHVPVEVSPETIVALADLRVSLDDDTRQHGAEILRTWRDRAADAGVTLEAEAMEAPAQEALIGRAEARSADLIVVGSHGRRGIRRLVLGSVAEVVVRHAPCSVLIARG